MTITAPELPGFTPIRFLGRGGFAEVHLYEQAMPRREVAVKILSTTLRGDSTVEAFEAEANLMAAVSSHPAIVTIFQADVSPDGRPFIVMEHCPKPNLQQRTRHGGASVADALRIGIQLSGAVETAHRAGILHRDIKPANVLFTQYDRPALTDFGIANSLTSPTTGDVGLSVSWAPPEAFDGVRSDVRLDVWALGAILYAMLAGHAPFHIPGGENGHREQIQRIRSAALPPIAREDVPESLDRLIGRALSKDPAGRPATAFELGRGLQRVQVELALVQTSMDVFDALEEQDERDADDETTHLRSALPIDRPPVVPQHVPAPAAGTSAPTDVHTTSIVADTVLVHRASDDPGPVAPRPRRGPPALLIGAVGVVAAAAGVVLIVAPW